MTINPRVLAIHDLSGFGHTSLLEVLPLLYRMGLEAAVLPSVLLSANTDHPGYRQQDTTQFIKQSIEHWQKLGLRFDAVFSGFLGSPEQAILLQDAIPLLKTAVAPVLIDPVLGDDGRLYDCYTPAMALAMRNLISVSTVITPNLTEAALLLNEPYPQGTAIPDLHEWGFRLSQLGPETVIITSAQGSIPEESRVYCYHRPGDEGREFACHYVPVVYPGAGDCFSTLVLGGLMHGYSVWQSVQAAVSYLNDAISDSLPLVKDRRTGIALAHVLASDPLEYLKQLEEN